MPCQFSYIPERLHSNDRPTNDNFSIGERLYRRCPEEEKKDPFQKISLVDVSVNRSGFPLDSISFPNDVLFNNNPGKYGDVETVNEAVVTLDITELDNKQYKKECSDTRKAGKEGKEETHKCLIHLKHKKEDCNYSHCALEIFYDGKEVTFQNYAQTMKRNNHLRNWCRHELARMIIKEEVRINWAEETAETNSEER